MTLPLNIILAQINPTVGDLSGNADKIKAVYNAHQDADLIVFPEMVVTGYPCDDLLTRASFILAAQKQVCKLTEECIDGPAIVIGAPEYYKDGLYNAAYLIFGGKVQHTVFKHILPNDGVFDEARYFESGTLPKCFTYKGVKLGIIICEDVWHPFVTDHYAKQGVELLISPNASPHQTDKIERRHEQIKARVKSASCPLIYLNQIGGQDDLIFDGSSFVMNEKGEIIYQLPAFEESIHDTKKPLLAPTLPPQETLYKAVTLGLKDYVQKNGFEKVLIGLSGGIDSALCAAIAVDALGSKNVRCIMMPSPYTSQDSLDDAEKCANLLDVTLDTISIEPAMAVFGNMLTEHIDEENTGTTFENIQSRIRGMTLMALSNSGYGLLLSTGNKSEMAMGYATLYGDMCGAFNPLKDLYKTQIYKLATWRNKQNTVIPERIITKAPSAELKPDQTDQDTLPPYDILDNILQCLIEDEMAIDDIPQARDTVLKIAKMLERAEYKRTQSPPGPKVTNKAFGRDRRYPMTNGFEKSDKTA